tara:strand:+ start:481 stop:828 length:348 start_codon:yes stop_codon:yes gene_type:complete
MLILNEKSSYNKLFLKRINEGNKLNRDPNNHKLIDKMNTPCHSVLIANTGNRKKGDVEYQTPYNSNATIATSMKNSTRDPPHRNQLKCSVDGLFKDIFSMLLYSQRYFSYITTLK